MHVVKRRHLSVRVSLIVLHIVSCYTAGIEQNRKVFYIFPLDLH